MFNGGPDTKNTFLNERQTYTQGMEADNVRAEQFDWDQRDMEDHLCKLFKHICFKVRQITALKRNLGSV